MNLTYTRFVDDLVFSGDDPRPLISSVVSFLHQAGFNISRKKLEIMGPSGLQAVTGFSVNGKSPSVPRFRRDMIRLAVWNLGRIDVTDPRYLKVRKSVEGRIRYLSRDFHFARRIRAFIHQHASPHARFLQRTLFCSQLPSVWGRARRETVWSPLSGHSSYTAPHLCSFFASVQRSPAILRAPAAPRSSAACRRTAAGSDALLPAGASNTAHASPAGPRFSLAAAGDSSATSA